MNICLNCGTEVADKYCPHCGQEYSSKRLQVKTIIHDAIHGILHWENSILKTFREILLRPGKTAKSYISGARRQYVRPFTYFIFIQTIYVLFFHRLSGEYFAFLNFSIKSPGMVQEQIVKFQQIVNAYLNYLNYFMPIIFAAYFRLLYKKKTGINYAEAVAASFYWVGTTLVFGIIIMLMSIIDIRIWDLRILVNIIFLSFALIKFSGRRGSIKGILKGVLTVILSYLTFALFVSAVLLIYFYITSGKINIS